MMFVIMLGSAIVFTSCGSDDDDDYNGGSGSSSGSGKITVALATNKVQTAKLHKIKDIRNEYSYTIPQGEQVIFYKDYNYKYGLCLYGNNLAVVPYALNPNGNLEHESAVDNGAIAGIIDLGKFNGINEVNEVCSTSAGHKAYLSSDECYSFYGGSFGKTLDFLKSNKGNFGYHFTQLHGYWQWYSTPAYPNHGYAIAFNTFEDGVKFIRVYEKSYTQQNDGELTDITVEYQLFDPIVPKE